MKLVKICLLVSFGLLLLSAALQPAAETAYTLASIAQYKREGAAFAASLKALQQDLGALQPGDKQATLNAREALRQCRLSYKRIEFFAEYFFEYPVNLYNRAPVYEVEEPYAEYQSPIGLQVIEGMLMEDDPYAHKKELTDQCEVLAATAADIPAQLYGLKVSDAQLLEAIRLELVRIPALGITGYDAPQLKTGMEESATALEAVQASLQQYGETHSSQYKDSLNFYLTRSISLLRAHPEFNGFDRLGFLTTALLPLQEQLGLFIREQGLDLTTHPVLNYTAGHLFRKNALNLDAFRQGSDTAGDARAALGRELFFEKALSGNGRRNCATCHRPDKAFTDGLAKSRDLDERSEVTRNAPTLYYAAYQHAQFYDGRAASLEAQIRVVLQNKHEMAADLDAITAWLSRSDHYRQAFGKAYPGMQGITTGMLAGALAAYEQTLAPFSSPFDRYMAGDAAAMTAQQQQGFNLFMGKAQCGTCHFAPLFNGLLPPFYERTESEVLGVPQNASFRHPRADTDSGRYHFFAISFNNGAFKTSTVRNAAATAPYMHNGVFKNLDEVLEFYNRGGGKGLGLNVANQTLSDQPLHLTKKEKKAVITFLQALTDRPMEEAAGHASAR